MDKDQADAGQRWGKSECSAQGPQRGAANSFPVPGVGVGLLRFLHLGPLRAPCVQMTNLPLCELL